MEEKILRGQRKGQGNKIKGGHSPQINNSNPDYAVETICEYPDGTKKIKFIKMFSDGNVSKIKTSTIFPESWTDEKIIECILEIGDNPPIAYRPRDGATLHRAIIDGVEIEVIKEGNIVTSGYPTGGTGIPDGFILLK